MTRPPAVRGETRPGDSRRVLRSGASLAATLGVLGGATVLSCIIPDRDIQFEGGPSNPGAVRILERTPLPEQWNTWCLDGDLDEADAFCPATRPTRRSGLLTSTLGDPFCVCPDGQRDLRAPPLWTMYAEDPDLVGELPADTLYGVLLLDPDPLARDPGASVAYENFLEPCSEGRVIDPFYSLRADGATDFIDRVVPSEARDLAPQWAFRIDDAEGDVIDLCNDDNGTSLPPGLHNLQFMVTDRPFFRAQSQTTDDEFSRLQCGVPDIAVGATYAVINYVFECIDGTLEENLGACDCEDIE